MEEKMFKDEKERMIQKKKKNKNRILFWNHLLLDFSKKHIIDIVMIQITKI